jgi:glycosyltransferase involved in cell wall biosynthesis
MFSSAKDLLAAKEDRAAYTSMPYRGLDLLVGVIAKMRGGTQFDIYSAMQTYRMPEENFAELYTKVKAAPRTRYRGSLPQPMLARELRSAAYLSYPCTFVETYCIAALEAIAAGLKVVSVNIGSLPETTLGFADLMRVTPDMTDELAVASYTELLERNAASFRKNPAQWAQERFEQSQTVNRICSWRARAAEWERLLNLGIARSRA